jgi:sugar transferase (PEP-CTERM/EpsH1 system associated)
MRDILFLAHRLPWPPERGDKIRSYNILRYLRERARVHLLSFADDVQDIARADELRPHFASLHVEWRSPIPGPAVLGALLTRNAASVAMFASRGMHRHVARLLHQEDIGTIFAFSGQMAQFVPRRISARFLMDFVDVDSEKFAAYANGGPSLLRWLYRREALLLGRFEQVVAQRADRSIFVSEAEAALFRDLSGLDAERVIAIENGINLDYFQPYGKFQPLDPAERGAGPLLVFTGQMDYRPNIDAVVNFALNMMPVLRHVRPDVRFVIVGRNPPPEVVRLADTPGVFVTGEVLDVRPWVAAADVVVVPLQIARGVQNKVLEAMAMGRPVVATPAAVEGIDVEPGRDLIVADGDGMATSVLALLRDAERAAKIGRQARARVESRYRWEDRLAALGDLLAP